MVSTLRKPNMEMEAGCCGENWWELSLRVAVSENASQASESVSCVSICLSTLIVFRKMIGGESLNYHHEPTFFRVDSFCPCRALRNTRRFKTQTKVSQSGRTAATNCMIVEHIVSAG